MAREFIRTFDESLLRHFGKSGRLAFLCLGSSLCTLSIFRYKYQEVIKTHENPADITSDTKLFFLRLIFGRTRSRFAGWLLNKPMPPAYRETIYRFLTDFCGWDTSDIRYPLASYKSIGHLFCRTLQDGSRMLDEAGHYSMLSPCDCHVKSFGLVDGKRIPQIKGANYSVAPFLGLSEKALQKKNLHYITLYLAPNNYHHFHSPCDFKVITRRHFSGEVLPVFEKLASYISDIFSVNERVVLSGEWNGGDIHYTAVGSYNVGSIRLSNEKEFRTNELRTQLYYLGGDIDVKSMKKNNGLLLPKGQEIGEFRFGSTVVLIFEAPDTFEWNVKEGEFVRVGKCIGKLSSDTIKQSNKYAFYGESSN